MSCREPVFVLGLPRSFTSVVCAMLGQHPEMFGLPELHLFSARSVSHWQRVAEFASFNMRDGLLRAIALLFYGAQTAETVECARGWLNRRSHCTTGIILEEIAEAIRPKRVVEKSPSIVYRVEYMVRAFQMFPQARFIHLTRHPAGQGQSVLKSFQTIHAAMGGAPYWVINLLSYGYWPKTARARREAAACGYHENGNSSREPAQVTAAGSRLNGQVPPLSGAASGGPCASYDLDPQRSWYALNRNIREFLEMVPEKQKIRIRGEDVLHRPDESLRKVANWLGVRSDADAIDSMKHPERSPFSSMGPPNAPLGNDGLFLANPRLRPERAGESCAGGISMEAQGPPDAAPNTGGTRASSRDSAAITCASSLEENVPWRQDGRPFSPEVKELARIFGY